MQTESGKGVLNLLAADRDNAPKLYSTFLLWILSELFETFPKPVTWTNRSSCSSSTNASAVHRATSGLDRKGRAGRSPDPFKGRRRLFRYAKSCRYSGQSIAQLGNRVQHALRAYTPQEQKAVKVAAQTFRENPKIDVEKAITELGVGEVLISMLDEKGIPAMVDRAFVVPPLGQIGPITADQRAQLMANSLVAGQYEQAVDRESAFEILQKKTAARMEEQAQTEAADAAAKQAAAEAKATKASAGKDTIYESIGKSVARSMGSSLGRQIGSQIVRGVLGGILGGGSKKKSSWW